MKGVKTKMPLETRLKKIKNLLGGTAVFQIGISGKDIELLSVKKCMNLEELEMEKDEAGYIG